MWFELRAGRERWERGRGGAVGRLAAARSPLLFKRAACGVCVLQPPPRALSCQSRSGEGGGAWAVVWVRASVRLWGGLCGVRCMHRTNHRSSPQPPPKPHACGGHFAGDGGASGRERAAVRPFSMYSVVHTVPKKWGRLWCTFCSWLPLSFKRTGGSPRDATSGGGRAVGDLTGPQALKSGARGWGGAGPGGRPGLLRARGTLSATGHGPTNKELSIYRRAWLVQRHRRLLPVGKPAWGGGGRDCKRPPPRPPLLTVQGGPLQRGKQAAGGCECGDHSVVRRGVGGGGGGRWRAPGWAHHPPNACQSGWGVGRRAATFESLIRPVSIAPPPANGWPQRTPGHPDRWRPRSFRRRPARPGTLLQRPSRGGDPTSLSSPAVREGRGDGRWGGGGRPGWPGSVSDSSRPRTHRPPEPPPPPTRHTAGRRTAPWQAVWGHAAAVEAGGTGGQARRRPQHWRSGRPWRAVAWGPPSPPGGPGGREGGGGPPLSSPLFRRPPAASPPPRPSPPLLSQPPPPATPAYVSHSPLVLRSYVIFCTRLPTATRGPRRSTPRSGCNHSPAPPHRTAPGSAALPAAAPAHWRLARDWSGTPQPPPRRHSPRVWTAGAPTPPASRQPIHRGRP